MKSNAEQLSGLMEFLNSQTHVTPEEIPNIDLYMDQVTTFMEEHLKDSKRYEEDKVLKVFCPSMISKPFSAPLRPDIFLPEASPPDFLWKIFTVRSFLWRSVRWST